jgi:hypothetical protein
MCSLSRMRVQEKVSRLKLSISIMCHRKPVLLCAKCLHSVSDCLFVSV